MLRTPGVYEHPAIGTAGLAAPRLPLAAFSSVNSLSEAASLLGQLMRLPGIAALRRAGGAPESGVSGPIAGHSYCLLTGGCPGREGTFPARAAELSAALPHKFAKASGYAMVP
jgi:hypothetical protein